MLNLWQFSDGKRGHERQSEGLLRAICDAHAATIHRLEVHTERWPTVALLRRRFAAAEHLPPPHLIVGAGNACHAPMLAARQRYGGAVVCLMRPQLPRAWFDVCVIPRHDQPRPHPRTITSEGPLNPMRPAPAKDPDHGLILLGGPSRHHRWQNDDVIAQLRTIVTADPARQWTVADSRRTPADFAAALTAAAIPGLHYQPFINSAPDWLTTTLACTPVVWVSADSVAMLYDALSAGAEVGLITVPPARNDRISRIGPDLVRRGWVRTAGDRRATQAPVLNEATRIAGELFQRLPQLRAGAT